MTHYDPVSFVGDSPLHVDIELPVRTLRTVCDHERCFELSEADGVPAENHTLQVPAWTSNTTAAAKEVADALDLWRAADLAIIEHRVALERTRKATPVDPRLHRTHDAAPIVSFDGFYPPSFVLHTENLYFDAQRVKVGGSFRPPADGDVCISVETVRDDVVSDASSDERPPEQCFDNSYNAHLSGFADAKGTHSLTVRLKRRDTGETAGDGDRSSFVAAPALRPQTPWDTAQGRFIKLLRDAVVGWLYPPGPSGNATRAASRGRRQPGTVLVPRDGFVQFAGTSTA